jgi:prepilin-type N-terminal cleavage/methylation domain-containing protein/prepilin-type processing-associated H-X9-DG protein
MRKAEGFSLVEMLIVMVIMSLLASVYMAVFTAVREKARANVCMSNMRQIGIGLLEYVQDHDETMPIGATTGDPGGSPDVHWYEDIATYVVEHKPNGNAGAFYVCPGKVDYITKAGGYGINANLVGAYSGGSYFGSSKSLPQIFNPISTFMVCDAAQLDENSIGAVNNDPRKWADIQTGPSDFQVTPPSSWDGTTTYYTEPPDDYNLRRPIARHQGGVNVVYVDGHIKWSHISQFVGPMPGGWPYGDTRNTWDNK